jgi:hypothetical protein
MSCVVLAGVNPDFYAKEVSDVGTFTRAFRLEPTIF